MNVRVVAVARRLLPDVWEQLEILPLSDPESDLDAAERDWDRLIKAAGAEQARQERDKKAVEGRQAEAPTGNGGAPAPPSKEARALALLVEHPDWTDKKIADHVPCNAKSLYRWPRYMAAREAAKQGRNDLPRGTKYPDDDGESNLEAWDDENA